MNFTKSNRKSSSLIRRLGAAQNPTRTSHPPVKADAVARHLHQVARAPVNKTCKCRVQVEWRYFLQHTPDKSLPPAFAVDKIYQALQNMKADVVTSHLFQVARAPVNKKHKRRVQVEWRYFLRLLRTKAYLHCGRNLPGAAEYESWHRSRL